MKYYLNNKDTCARVNLYGSDIEQLFRLNGYHKVNYMELADIIIINTCSFLKSKEDYFLNRIKEIHADSRPDQRILVIGCLGSICSEDIRKISPSILIFGRDKNEIKTFFGFKKDTKVSATHIKEDMPLNKRILSLLNDTLIHSKHIEFRLNKKKVCYIQISAGCRGACTYCSEKFTTKLHSTPIPDIIMAIEDGIKNGYTLFSLSSDDASAYGYDIGVDLDMLLSEIIKIKNKRISFIIPEFNPNGITDLTIELLKDPRFLYITIPIQSGSQMILDKMKRPYKIQDIVNKIRRIKKGNPNIMINSHLIVGFPGETDSDFAKTMILVQTGLLDRVKVFKYSQRPGTEASKYPNQINEQIKEKRAKELLNTIKKMNLKKKSLVNLLLNLDQIK